MRSRKETQINAALRDMQYRTRGSQPAPVQRRSAGQPTGMRAKNTTEDILYIGYAVEITGYDAEIEAYTVSKPTADNVADVAIVTATTAVGDVMLLAINGEHECFFDAEWVEELKDEEDKTPDEVTTDDLGTKLDSYGLIPGVGFTAYGVGYEKRDPAPPEDEEPAEDVWVTRVSFGEQAVVKYGKALADYGESATNTVVLRPCEADGTDFDPEALEINVYVSFPVDLMHLNLDILEDDVLAYLSISDLNDHVGVLVSQESYTVKVSASDDAPGPLIDKVVGGNNILTYIGIGPSGTDEALVVDHDEWEGTPVFFDPVEDPPTLRQGLFPGDMEAGGGLTISETEPADEGFIKFTEYTDEYDPYCHSLMTSLGSGPSGESVLKTWYIAIPGAAGTFKVKVTGDDTTEDFLDATIVAGDSITTNVLAAGGDEKLEINHGNPLAMNPVAGPLAGDITGGNGVLPGLLAAPATAPYIEYDEFQDAADANLHSLVSNTGIKKFIELPVSPDEKVKADAADPAAGFLADKVTVIDGVNKVWLEQKTANNKVVLEHKAFAFTEGYEFDVCDIINSGGGGVVATQATPDAGYAYFIAPHAQFTSDEAGHNRYHGYPAGYNSYIKWLALPTDATSDDRIRWDGTKWVSVPWVKSVGNIRINATSLDLEVQYTKADGTLDAWETVTNWVGTECA